MKNSLVTVFLYNRKLALLHKTLWEDVCTRTKRRVLQAVHVSTVVAKRASQAFSATCWRENVPRHILFIYAFRNPCVLLSSAYVSDHPSIPQEITADIYRQYWRMELVSCTVAITQNEWNNNNICNDWWKWCRCGSGCEVGEESTDQSGKTSEDDIRKDCSA